MKVVYKYLGIYATEYLNIIKAVRETKHIGCPTGRGSKTDWHLHGTIDNIILLSVCSEPPNRPFTSSVVKRKNVRETWNEHEVVIIIAHAGTGQHNITQTVSLKNNTCSGQFGPLICSVQIMNQQEAGSCSGPLHHYYDAIVTYMSNTIRWTI